MTAREKARLVAAPVVVPTPEPASPEKHIHRRWPWLVACVPFGLLMALRETSPSLWVRAAIAGAAFVLLGFAYRQFTKQG